MKVSKLAELGDDELRKEAEGMEEQLFRLRFQIQTGNAENPSRIRETRRDLARVKTLMRERELGIRRHREASAEPVGRAAAGAQPATSGGSSAAGAGRKAARKTERKGKAERKEK